MEILFRTLMMMRLETLARALLDAPDRGISPSVQRIMRRSTRGEDPQVESSSVNSCIPTTSVFLHTHHENFGVQRNCVYCFLHTFHEDFLTQDSYHRLEDGGGTESAG